MGLKTGIWALRLEFGPRDWDLRRGDVEGEEGEGENPPYYLEHKYVDKRLQQ